MEVMLAYPEMIKNNSWLNSFYAGVSGIYCSPPQCLHFCHNQPHSVCFYTRQPILTITMSTWSTLSYKVSGNLEEHLTIGNCEHK